MRNLLLLFSIGVLGGCASNKPVTCVCKWQPYNWDSLYYGQFYMTPYYKIPDFDTNKIIWGNVVDTFYLGNYYVPEYKWLPSKLFPATTDSVIFLP
jgi:hypothetical protein